MKKVSRVLNNDSINNMIKALRKIKSFDINQDNESIVIKHSKAGEVLRALKTPAGWLTRYNTNLFS